MIFILQLKIFVTLTMIKIWDMGVIKISVRSRNDSELIVQQKQLLMIELIGSSHGKGFIVNWRNFYGRWF